MPADQLREDETAEVFAMDPEQSTFVSIFGRKGSGKSKLAAAFWGSYPNDRIVIDPTKDVWNHEDRADTKILTEPLPGRFPVDVEGNRVSLCYHPDAGAATFRDDLDRAVGLAFWHPGRASSKGKRPGPCLLWIDELHVLGGPNQTGPNMARTVNEGRHRNLTALFCGPRPKTINPLVLHQSDRMAIFDLPNPDDREAVAKSAGIHVKTFDELINQLGPHEYLWINTRSTPIDVVHCPKLPL